MSAPTRRGLLGTLPAAALVPAAPAATPDAKLMQLAATLAAGVAEQNAIEEPYFSIANGKPTGTEAARADQLSRQWHRIRKQMAETRATTPEELRAKAGALLLQYEPGGEEDTPSPDNDDYLAWSLCRDLLA